MSRRVNFDLAAVTAYPKTVFASKTSVADGGPPLKLDVESGNASTESDFTSAVAVAAAMQALSVQDWVLLCAVLRRAAAALLSYGASSTSCTTQSVWLLYSVGVWAEHKMTGGPTHNSLDYLKALGDFLVGRNFADGEASSWPPSSTPPHPLHPPAVAAAAAATAVQPPVLVLPVLLHPWQISLLL